MFANNMENLNDIRLRDTVKIFSEKAENQIKKFKKIEEIGLELANQFSKILNDLENKIKTKRKDFYDKIIPFFEDLRIINEHEMINSSYFIYIDAQLSKLKKCFNMDIIDKLKNDMNKNTFAERISNNDIEYFFGDRKFKSLVNYFENTKKILPRYYNEYINEQRKKHDETKKMDQTAIIFFLAAIFIVVVIIITMIYERQRQKQFAEIAQLTNTVNNLQITIDQMRREQKKESSCNLI